MFAFNVTDSVQRTRISDASAKISSELMSSLELDSIMRTVVDNLALMARANAGGLCLIEGGEWIGQIGYGEYSDEMVQDLRLPYREMLSGVIALKSREAVAIEDAATDERCSPSLIRQFNIKSALIVPLVAGRETIGIVWVTRTDRVQHFSEEQARFATTVGTQAALAISNARAYENERRMKALAARRNAELDALYTVSQSLSQAPDLQVLLEQILRTVIGLELFQLLNRRGIMLLEGDSLKLVCHTEGHTPEFLESHQDLRVGDCLCGLAAKTGELIVSPHSATDSNHTIRYPGMEDHGHAIVPLKANNRTLGIMYLYLPADAVLDDRSRDVLESIGNQLGVAIDNAARIEGRQLAK